MKFGTDMELEVFTFTCKRKQASLPRATTMFQSTFSRRATSEDLIDYCKPIARRAPDVIILHVGTNELDKRDEDSIVENIKKIKNEIVSVSPKTKVLVSLIIGRYDDGNLNDKGVLVNDKLMRELPRSDIIDNSNLDRQCVGLKGLHLNRLGNKHLALNFKQVLNGL